MKQKSHWLWLLPLSAFVWGCNHCGDIACGAPLKISFDEPLANGDYIFDIETSGSDVSCAVSISGETFDQDCSGELELFIGRDQIYIFTSPSTVEVSLSGVDSEEVVTEKFDVNYQVKKGVCPRNCKFAQVSMPVPAP